jgi:hypothetical protein
MPGMESAPSPDPQRRKPFKEAQPDSYDINHLINPIPRKGGELVPVDKPDRQHPHQNGYQGDIAGSLDPGEASAPARSAAPNHSGGSYAGSGVATLERTATHTATATETASGGSAPPEISVSTMEAEATDPLRIVLTSLDQNVDAFAREAAHEKLNEKIEGPWWKRIAKSAWRNITREVQLVNATQEAREEIIQNENLLHHRGKSDEKWREATVDRWGSEYGEQLVHDGETFHKLNTPEAQKDPKAERIRGDIQDVMREVAQGKVSDDSSLDMMLERKFEDWNRENISQEYIGEGKLLATNIARKSRELEAMINSAEGLSAVDKEALIEAHLSKLEIVAGEARVGSRTEIDSTFSERIGEKLRKIPFISEERVAKVVAALGDENTVAAMVSGTIYAAQRGASLLGQVVAPGIGAGIVAGIRERNALMDERDLEARRSDAGVEDPELPDESEMGKMRKALRKIGLGKTEAEYRTELKATEYESRPAGELLDKLGGLYNEKGELNIMDRGALDEAIKLHGQVRARIQIGDRTDARLINFADVSPEEMESRRFDLDLAMAKLETDMRKMFENPVAQAMLDIKPDEKFDDLHAQQREAAEGLLMGEMTAKDRLFRKLVAKRVFKRVVAATFMGAAIGGAVKFGAEAAKEAYHSIRETFSGLFSSEAGATGTGTPDIALASFETEGTPPDHVGTPDHVGSPATPDHVGTADNSPDHVGTTGGPDHVGTQEAPDHVGTSEGATPDHVGTGSPDHVGTPEQADAGATPISETSKVNLPEGYKTDIDTQDGTITITGPDGKEYPNLALNEDGSLSGEALDALKANGFTVSDQYEVVQGEPNISESNVTPSEFVENHRADMKVIHHTGWKDNNTSKFDLNELEVQNRMDSNGNIIIDIKGMTAGGSFHGASGVNWEQAAKEGHLKVYMSASQGTQANAFEISVNPDGTAVVEKGTPAAALFNDQGKFIGGYQEIALNGGQAADGGENIATLATVVGERAPTITDTIETPTLLSAHTYTIQPPIEPAAFETPPDNVIPFAPTSGRTTRRNIGVPETPAPDAPLAPVIPIRPVAAISSAPEPARNPEAELRAQTMGLGPAVSTPEGGAATTSGGDTEAGGDQREQREQTDQREETESFTPAETQLIRSIDAENRPFPPQFDSSILKGLSKRERGLVTRLMYDAMLANPRGSNENPFGYTRRIIRVVHSGAERGRIERMPLMSRSLQSIAGNAFQALSDTKMAAPPSGSSRAA